MSRALLHRLDGMPRRIIGQRAGIEQFSLPCGEPWIPACAGMTAL
jgi:hypothetical protein